MSASSQRVGVGSPPFDTSKLDSLLDEAAIDALLITTRFNTLYVLGGHYPHLFATGPTMGLEGYLTIVGYVPGRIDDSFLVGNLMIGDTPEAEREAHPATWVAEQRDDYWTTPQAGVIAAEMLGSRGLASATIGVELAYLPAAAYAALSRDLPHARFHDASPELEELRAVKTRAEIDTLRAAHSGLVEVISETLAEAHAGIPKLELVDRLHIADARHGLRFHHGLVTAGPSLVRSANTDRWNPGGALSVDHAGDLNGYFGDVTRMACMGELSSEIEAGWEQVSAVQSALLRASRPGATGSDVVAAGNRARSECPSAAEIGFTCHGIGLNQHEAPRLSEEGFDEGPRSYRERPLATGMVFALETWLTNRSVGMLKVEDSAVVTAHGCDLLAGGGLDWTIVDG